MVVMGPSCTHHWGILTIILSSNCVCSYHDRLQCGTCVFTQLSAFCLIRPACVLVTQSADDLVLGQTEPCAVRLWALSWCVCHNNSRHLLFLCQLALCCGGHECWMTEYMALTTLLVLEGFRGAIFSARKSLGFPRAYAYIQVWVSLATGILFIAAVRRFWETSYSFQLCFISRAA